MPECGRPRVGRGIRARGSKKEDRDDLGLTSRNTVSLAQPKQRANEEYRDDLGRTKC